MAKRCLVWLLTGFLVTGLLMGMSGCKEEKEAGPRKETLTPEGTMPAEAKQAAQETKTAQDTLDFEEQEGVPQDSPEHYDE